MKSIGSILRSVACGLAYGAIGLAQPASQVTTVHPVVGPAVLDAAGNLYTFRTSGPVTAGAYQTQPGGGLCQGVRIPVTCTDAHVAKSDAAGNLVFGTFVGGTGGDDAMGAAVDAEGNVYVTGHAGPGFPVTPGAARSATSGGFLSKLSADGKRLIYSTYLPTTFDYGIAVAVDAQGNAYVAGVGEKTGPQVVKVNPSGSAFLYQAELSPREEDWVVAIAVDSRGDAAVVGYTRTTTFPVTANAVQKELAGPQDIFVVKLNGAGGVIFSTLLGGGGDTAYNDSLRGSDHVNEVQMDAEGNVYVAGWTSSREFPTTAGSFQPVPLVPAWSEGAELGFVTKLSADGSALVWSTYVTGERAWRLAVSGTGDVFVAGMAGPQLPVTASAPQACLGGGSTSAANPFVEHLGQRGELLDATYGGSAADEIRSVRLAANGSVLVAWSRNQANLSTDIRFGGTGWKQPACLSLNVANAASMLGHQVTPGEFVSLTGLGIGPEEGVVYQANAEGEIPRELAGVQVLFDGEAAPVLYAQSRQVNVLVPFELRGRNLTRVRLVYKGATIGDMEVAVVTAQPGLFRLQPGVSAQALAVNPDGTYNSESNPVARGAYISLWGTGLGPISPACTTGGLNPAGPVNLETAYSAQGFSVGSVEYMGSAPTLPCGVQQVNVVVRTDLAPGEYNVRPFIRVRLSPTFSDVWAGGGGTIWVK